MEHVVKTVVAVLLLGLLAIGIGWGIQFWIRLRWPAQLPTDLMFEHELTSDLKLRELAQELSRRFTRTDDVVCLGIVRGVAARVLFHSGPLNRGRNVNIHRADYLLTLTRLGPRRVQLRLEINRMYSYVRAKRSEIEPLVRALRANYGTLDTV
jgi:hypothetical protein